MRVPLPAELVVLCGTALAARGDAAIKRRDTDATTTLHSTPTAEPVVDDSLGGNNVSTAISGVLCSVGNCSSVSSTAHAAPSGAAPNSHQKTGSGGAFSSATNAATCQAAYQINATWTGNGTKLIDLNGFVCHDDGTNSTMNGTTLFCAPATILRAKNLDSGGATNLTVPDPNYVCNTYYSSPNSAMYQLDQWGGMAGMALLLAGAVLSVGL